MYKTILVGLVLTLTACAAPKVVEKPMFSDLPDALLVSCNFAPPPAKDAYLAANDQDKEDMLTSTLNKQYVYTGICQNNIVQIRAWKAAHKALFNTPGLSTTLLTK
jgi:hypothetical protein